MDGIVKAVINTISGCLAPLRDGFHLRRTAGRAGMHGTSDVNVMPLPEHLRMQQLVLLRV